MSKLTRTARRRIAFTVSYIFLSLVGITMIFPLFWMLLTSFKTPADDVLSPSEWWPRVPWRLGHRDIRDYARYCRVLRDAGLAGDPGPAARAWELIPADSRRTVLAVAAKQPLSASRRKGRVKASEMVLQGQKSTIVAALNEILQRRDYYHEPSFANVGLSGQAQRLLSELRAGPLGVQADTVRGWSLLIARLQDAATAAPGSPGARVWAALPPDLQAALQTLVPLPADGDTQIGAGPEIPVSIRDAIVAALDQMLNESDLFAGVDLSELQTAAAPGMLPEPGSGLGAEPGSRQQNAFLLEAPFRRNLVFEGYDARVRHFNRLLLDASFPKWISPTHRFHWQNYEIVIVETHFARVLFNSVLVSVSVTVGMVFTSSLAAFAFARLQFFGRDKIFLGYLATMMIPGAVTMIPVFILIRHLGWVNTYYALIVPAMFSTYGTFMLRQFFMSLPRDLEEAALLDGCSIWGIYRHVVVPLSKPALAALTILTFMGVWRGFMWPLIVTHTRDMYTLPVALAAFREMYGVRWTLMMAGSVIMIVPMLIVFIFGQRYFIEGIKLGALKG